MSSVMDTVSYDQYSNIPAIDDLGANSKIIFSEKSYKKMMELIINTSRSNAESGCFFVGRKSKDNPFSIYIDYNTSEFLCEDGIYKNGSANPTQQTYEELNYKIQEYKAHEIRPCIFHFHTHPRNGYYESFSDQDLHTYAKMAYDNPSYYNFGILGFPVGQSTIGISVVLPNEPQKVGNKHTADFYMYPNICYCISNSVFKMGAFEKKYQGRKTRLSDTSNSNRIIRNYIQSNVQKNVCSIGKNPNNNLNIDDSEIGYIDSNGCICIPNEQLTLDFTGMDKKKEAQCL